MTFLQELLTKALDVGASDMHIVVGMPPLFRIHTVLEPVEGYEMVTSDQAEQFVRDLVNEKRFEYFMDRRDLDFSTAVPGRGRFRVNAHFQRDTVAIAFRAIWIIPVMFFMTLLGDRSGTVSHVGHLGGVVVAWIYLRRDGAGGRLLPSLSQLQYRLHRWRMRRRLKAVRREEHDWRHDDDQRLH